MRKTGPTFMFPSAFHPIPRRNRSHPDPAIRRREFLSGLLGGVSACFLAPRGMPAMAAETRGGIVVPAVGPREDLPAFIRRTKGAFDQTLYRQLLGAGNEFKEGDQYQGVAAADATSRENARLLLARTRIRDFIAHPIYQDAVSQYIDQAVDADVGNDLANWTIGELHRFLLESNER